MQQATKGIEVVGSMSPLDEGKALWQNVILLIHALSMADTIESSAEYVDVHLLTEVVASIFPRHLVAQHGYVYHLAAREEIARFESAQLLKKLWREVTIYFRKDDIQPKLGYLKPVPYSWLLHSHSGTIIDVIPVGGEPFVDMPVRHPPHPDRVPYNLNPSFELLKGKLPNKEYVDLLRAKLEKLVQDNKCGDISRAIYYPIT